MAAASYKVPLKSDNDDGEPKGGGGRSDVPELYAAALSRRWNVVTSRAQNEPQEACYADPTDGLTALHLAVISRTTPTDVRYGRGGKTSTRLRDSNGAEVAGTRRIKCPAPMNAIRTLLLANPNGALARCRRYGYTPLAYACHVPPPDKESLENDDEENYTVYTHGTRSTVYQSVFRDSYGILDECEKLVRLILNYRPDCASVLSRDGLSPLDLHIMSYSVGWGYEHDNESAAGRTNTGVLRTLLEEEPALARSRPRGGGTGTGTGSTGSAGSEGCIGPLEILYKYNAASFIKVLEGQDTMASRPGMSDQASRSARRARRAWYEELDGGGGGGSTSKPSPSGTRQTLSSWWVWKWSILLLKYLHHRRGSKFQAVHAASSAPGCPLPLLMLAVRAFPNQIREADEMSGNGNLPLHIVASWGLGPPPRARARRGSAGEEARIAAQLAAAADPIASRTKAMLLSELLTEYPAAAKVRNAEGKTALGLLVESGGTWNGGVRRLVRAYPPALTMRDRRTGLMPFMASAAAAARADGAGDGRRGSGGGAGAAGSSSGSADLKAVNTVFELLRADPRALRPMRSKSKGKRRPTKRR